MSKLIQKMVRANMKLEETEELRSLINEQTTMEELYKIFLQNIKKMNQMKITLNVERVMRSDNWLDVVRKKNTITIKKKDIEKYSLDTSYTDWGGMTLYDYCKSVLRKHEVNTYYIKELEIVSHKWKWGKCECRITQPDNQLWIDVGVLNG